MCVYRLGSRPWPVLAKHVKALQRPEGEGEGKGEGALRVLRKKLCCASIEKLRDNTGI